MGMFDTITCQYPMPEGYEFLQDEEFQTKDFENLLEPYTITKDGRLIRTLTEWELLPEEERPYYGTEEWSRNSFFQLIGSMKTNVVGKKDMDYHGHITFYTSKGDVWYDVTAKFTDGVLVDLTVSEEKMNVN